MTTLSWMIYLAGALDGVKLAIYVAFVLCLFLAFVTGLYGTFTKDGYKVLVGDDAWERGHGYQVYAVKKLLPASLALLFIGALIPSQNTIYAIAASEMGEKVTKSETASKAAEALDAWLDRQIAAQSGDAK